MQGNYECYFQGKKKYLLELIKLAKPFEAECFMLSKNWNFLEDEDWAAMYFGSEGVSVDVFEHFSENDSCLFCRWMPALEALEGYTVFDYDMTPSAKQYLYSPFHSKEVLLTYKKSELRPKVSASEKAMKHKSVTQKAWEQTVHLLSTSELPQTENALLKGTNESK